MDVHSREIRSYNMSQINSEKTKPEMQLRKLLISYGFPSFEMNSKSVVGKPDFYFPEFKLAIFLDGCFWHGCKKCYQEPKTNTRFWQLKIKSNIIRDRIVNNKLKQMGISNLRVKEHELKKEPVKVIQKITKALYPIEKPLILDLFAGAGGLSEGFISNGCDIVGHIEMDKDFCSTIVTRMIYHALKNRNKLDEYKNYVTGKISRDSLVEKYELQKERDSVLCAKIGEDNYKELINEVKKRLDGKQLDIIVGGPPCQAYSNIGRARDKNNMQNDSRNYLYKYYVKFLKALNPKMFVFENVPGLLSAGKGKYLRKMRSLMRKVGYETDFRVLNAADYGVPQNRKRIILIGWKKDLNLSYPEFVSINRDYTVKDFLKKLPIVNAGDGKIVESYNENNPVLEKLGIIDPGFPFLLDHITRPNTEQDLEIYRLAVEYKKKGINIKYSDLPKELKTHSNEKNFLDRFKVVDYDARGSQTVVAHVCKDGHYYIHPDITQNRSLSVRELARLQTFPDNFKFEGSRTAQLRQIGNAVPPLLSSLIAKEVVDIIKKSNKNKRNVKSS